MLDHFKYIGNVGRFETVALKESLPFKALSLVYSENGRGKTTLCSILRSLASGDSAPILERKRLSAKSPSRVVTTVDGSDVSFDGTAWNAAGPRLLVFDEHFVDTNIYSGLTVTAGHRQSIHALVIGEEGIKLNSQVQDLTALIAELQATLRDREHALPATILGGLSVDDFCVLELPDDLDIKLEGARKTATVLRDAENIRTAAEFESFALPLLPSEAVVELLYVTLPEIEGAAVKAVTQHFSQLNNGRAEQWVSEGMEFAAESSSCPFCGQGLDGSVLIAHYQAYFSEAYRNHKTAITKTRETVRSSFDGDRLARLQRLLQGAQARHVFWARYIGLPEFDLDTEEVASAWVAAREGLLEVIDRKLASPFEPLSLSPQAVKAVEQYNAVAERIKKLSSTLLNHKPAIALAKEQASHGSLAAAEAQVARLEAIERRHDPETAKKCAAFLAAKLLKLSHEERKEAARTALNEHRKKVFGKYQTTINDFLLKFNADFSIDALKPWDAGGVTSSGYEFVVNKARIGLAPKAGAAPQPSFGTALSSGDRTTLALAFFFTTLSENAALANTIVVLDDPVTSLDDGRALATAQEIRGLIGRTAQVIVLSHARPSDAKKSEVKVAQEILAKYAGTYGELDIWNGGPIPRTIEITTSAGALFAELKGRGKVRLIAQSEKTFTGFFGLGIRFLVDDRGVVTHLAEMHVSGDYRFIRLK